MAIMQQIGRQFARKKKNQMLDEPGPNTTVPGEFAFQEQAALDGDEPLEEGMEDFQSPHRKDRAGRRRMFQDPSRRSQFRNRMRRQGRGIVEDFFRSRSF